MKLISILSDLLGAIADTPNFPFAEDVKVCCSISHFVGDEDIARHIASLISGCRATPEFRFGTYLDEAERAIEKFGFTLERLT